MHNISAVIPLHNKQEHIGRAINSVRAQTIPAMELIIVDDGSTDQGPQAARAMQDDRLRLISQENQGVSQARNTGIAHGNNEYIAFLDADDTWEPDFLQTIFRLIDTYPDAGAYATAYDVVEPDGRRHRADLKAIPDVPWEGLLPSYFESVATGANPVWSSAVCVRKSTFAAVGVFSVGVRLYEDLEMWTRIALRFPIAYSTKQGAIYYRNAQNRACNIIVPRDGEVAFEEVLTDAIEQKRIDGRTAMFAKMFIAKYSLLNAFKCVVAGNAEQAKKITSGVEAVTAQQKLRQLFILFLTMLPQAWVRFIWRIGKAAKG